MSTETKELLDELDLEAWFESESLDFKLSRGVSGMQINAKACPACGDRRWRVYLNAETGRGNCFVCNATFNKFSFLNAYRDEAPALTFQHIREFLRDQGWRPKRKVTAEVVMGEVKLPLSFALPTADGQNLVYLEERGITGDIAGYFHLRYCADGWWNFAKEDGSTGGQNFGQRVIIPVFDLDGTLATFQGRDVTLKAENKYLFPKGLPGTGRYLFNGQNVVGMKRLCVGEGAFDVAAIKIAFDEDWELRGVGQVGTFGKHLSYGSLDGNDQLGRFLRLKARGLEEVTLMWDGGAKELEDALAAARQLHGIGLRVRIATLPKGKDPNEVLPEVVRSAFRAATLYSRATEIRLRLQNPYSA